MSKDDISVTFLSLVLFIQYTIRISRFDTGVSFLWNTDPKGTWDNDYQNTEIPEELTTVLKVSRLVHVADDPLDGDAADGPPEEEVLDGAGPHGSQRRQQK